MPGQPYTPTPSGPTGQPVRVPAPSGPGSIRVDPRLAAEERARRLREAEEQSRNPVAIARRFGRFVRDTFSGNDGPAVPTVAPPDLPPPLDYPPGVIPSQGIQQDIAIAESRSRPGIPIIKDIIAGIVEYGPTGIRFLDAPGYVLTTPTPLGSGDVYYPPDWVVVQQAHGDRIQPHNAGRQDP